MFCEDAEELDYMERVYADQTWIDRSDTYNISLGGSGGSVKGRKSKSPSAETRRKISNSLKGHKVSATTRSKISQKNKGKKVSDEARAKMSETRKKMPCPNKGQHWHWKTTKNHKCNWPNARHSKDA